jgi:hypothetical protein
MKKLIAMAIGVLSGLAISAATRQPPQFGRGCIPCSPTRACENPLTVCVARSPNGEGCCLGQAN